MTRPSPRSADEDRSGERDASGWLAFWSRPRSIWVNERHRRVHYAKVADDLLALLPCPGARVLDFGCGAALEAGRCAEACSVLYLCEAAAGQRAELARRFARHPRIRVVDPRGMEEIPDHGLDLVFVNSVLQYLKPEEVPPLLRLWRRKLAPDGLLVLADVLIEPPSIVTDTVALLRTAWRHGFFLAALVGLLRLASGEYRRLRRQLGLTVYPPAVLAAMSAEAGFRLSRRSSNLGFNRYRATYLARCSGPMRPERPVPVTEERPNHHESRRQDLRGEVV